MTNFDTIENLALSIVEDYKLGGLYERDYEKFQKNPAFIAGKLSQRGK